MAAYGLKRLGKRPAATLDAATPRLRAVLAERAGDVWPDSDWRGGVYDGRILGDNDTVGDCVVVAAGNGVLVQSSFAGQAARMSDDEALANYITATDPPYDPTTGANDSGLSIAAFLKRWNLAGIAVAGATNRLIGYAYVDPKDTPMVRRATGLGGGILAGLRLPLTAQAQIAADQPWDVAGSTGDAVPGSWGGHGVWILGADPYGVWCVTWAQVQRITWAAWAAWADEAYLCLDPLFLNRQGLDPAALDLSAIMRAMPFAAAVAGEPSA